MLIWGRRCSTLLTSTVQLQIQSIIDTVHFQTKEEVAKKMMMDDSPLKLLFATDAYGMGVDCQDIRRIVHAGPPRSLEGENISSV